MYDPIILVENLIANIFSIKVILWSFELALSLRVNFSGSRLIGINLDYAFLDSAGGFLHCKIESLSSKYLGNPMSL